MAIPQHKSNYFWNQLKDCINSFVVEVNLPSAKANFNYCLDCIYEIKFAKFRKTVQQSSD